MSRRVLSGVVVAGLICSCGGDGPAGDAGSGGHVATGGTAGSAGTVVTGGSLAAGGTVATGGAGGVESCVAAARLWFEDFETGDYSRWTSNSYDADWHDGFCHDNGFSTEQSVRPTHSHQSVITCASTESHRGYGGLQFSGDALVPAYTNQGVGIDAPYGVVNTYHSWIDAPYDFANGKWFSFWTVNSDCGWAEDVVTLGLENDSWVLTPAHTDRPMNFAPDAPAFPRRQWVRTTIYINFYDGEMHVWQDGASVVHTTFTRPTTDICQWHWGAYANQDNDEVVLYEDDLSIWKLEERWTDWDVEPWLGSSVAACP